MNVEPEAPPAPPLLMVSELGKDNAEYANAEPVQFKYVPAVVGAAM